MTKEELRQTRKLMFDQMEKHLQETRKPEDSLFFHHPSEDRIVLTHALFWVMTASMRGHIAKQKHLLLLRQYQEEMLDAYLRETDELAELLRYSNILFEMLPIVIPTLRDLGMDKDVRRLMAITIVAGGFGGDMQDNLADEILDDMDYYYNKVKCRKIEQMLPMLNELVAEEMKRMFSLRN